MSPDRCCVLFTKPARPGRVKTRLIGTLSSREAADLHEAFLADLYDRLKKRPFELRLAWALEPGDLMHSAYPPGFAQVGNDLGERLFNGLREAARDHALVAAIGSDHPELPGERVDQAFDALASHDVALGPARDGGYYLIACRAERIDRALFTDIEWSSTRVVGQTLERAARVGLRVALLEEGEDVDGPEDLERLIRFLASTNHDCPSTANLLKGWGRLP